MTDGPMMSPEKIAKARTVLQGLPVRDRRKTRSQAAQMLESDFRRALRKGYEPAELSRILKKEGIIIPMHLIEKYSQCASEALKPEKKTVKKQEKQVTPAPPKPFTPTETSFVRPDLPDEEL